MKRHVQILAAIFAVFLATLPAAAQRRGFGDTRSNATPPGGSTAPAPPRNGGASQPSTVSSPEYAPPPALAPPPVIVIPVTVEPTAGVPLADAWPDAEQNSDVDGDAFVLWDFHTSRADAAFDFSEAERCASDDPAADVVFEVRDGEGYLEVSRDTDIRDLGSADDPADRPTTAAWSVAHEVLLVPGHAYLVWTWDDQFFRLVVTSESAHRVRFHWTQMDEDTHYRTLGLTRNGSSRPVFVRTKFPL